MRNIAEMNDLELHNYGQSIARDTANIANMLRDSKKEHAAIGAELSRRAAVAMFNSFDEDTANTVAALMHLLRVPVSTIDSLELARHMPARMERSE